MQNKPEKTLTIIVNTEPKPWGNKEISYQEVIVLAEGTYIDDPKIAYTVEYFRGEKEQHEGSLTKGQLVKVKEGMVFNVTKTDNS